MWDFFSLKATCACCGKEIGLNRYEQGRTKSGEIIWACPACARSGKLVNIDYETGKIKEVTRKETEVKVRCNTCGHLFCYDSYDIKRNIDLAKKAKTSSVLAAANALVGTRYDMYEQSKSADSNLSQIKDFSRCPKCNSSDIEILSDEEWEEQKESPNKNTNKATSIAEEIKEYKELLDIGLITQEEFDAKKNNY